MFCPSDISVGPMLCPKPGFIFLRTLFDFIWTLQGIGLGQELEDFFSGQSQALGNETNSPFPETETNNQRQTLVKIWNISTFLGVSGTILNGIILINFYLERNAIFTVVNVMIW